MPTHRAGSEIEQDPIRLKNLLDRAESMLEENGMRSPQARALIEPARDLVEMRRFWQHQSEGLVLFISKDEVRFYRLPLDFEELVVVSDRYHIKPLLPMLSGDGKFYVLALSQNDVRLLQGNHYSIDQVQLKDVPKSLEEALMWDDPDDHLQWHTGTQKVVGERPAMFFGQGMGSADDKDILIRRFFQKVADGLQDILSDERAPVVIAGVEYLRPIFREASNYQNILEDGINGNPEDLSAQELHERAWPLVQPQFQAAKVDATNRYRLIQGRDVDMASSDLEKVVLAAANQRVEILFVSKGLERWGKFYPKDQSVEIHENKQAGDQDLYDFAAVQTLLSGGQVYVVEPEEIPGGKPVAAILRY
jgi:hypothetical protein